MQQSIEQRGSRPTFTPISQNVLSEAGRLAIYSGHGSSGPEHVLLALNINPMIGLPLRDAGLHPEEVSMDIFTLPRFEKGKVVNVSGYTPEGQIMIRLARRSALRRTLDGPVFSADLLEGVSGTSFGRNILEKHELSLEGMRDSGIIDEMMRTEQALLESGRMETSGPNSLGFEVRRLEVEIANPDLSNEVRRASITAIQNLSNLIRATRPHGRL